MANQKTYKVKHNRYSGHFMYTGDVVVIEQVKDNGLLHVRSTYGTGTFTSTVHPEELEEIK